MTNETKKRNKKKVLIIALFLFAVVGLAGYGAYSYYWTEGEFDARSQISVSSFDPEVNTTNGDSFLGNGGEVSLYCPSSPTGSSSAVTCTADLEVKNNGWNPINVSVEEISSHIDIDSGIEGFEPSIDDPQYLWKWDDNSTSESSVILNGGETKTLHISVVFDSDDYTTTSNAVKATESKMANGYMHPTVNVKLNATQVHD